MAPNILLRLNRDRARSLREALADLPPGPASAGRPPLSEVNGLVREALTLREAMESVWETEYRRAVTDESLGVADLLLVRAELEEVFDSFIASAERALALARAAEPVTQELPSRTAALAEAVGAMRAIRHRVSADWPVINPAEAAGHAEAIPLDEAFAQIAGSRCGKLSPRICAFFSPPVNPGAVSFTASRCRTHTGQDASTNSSSRCSQRDGQQAPGGVWRPHLCRGQLVAGVTR